MTLSLHCTATSSSRDTFGMLCFSSADKRTYCGSCQSQYQYCLRKDPMLPSLQVVWVPSVKEDLYFTFLLELHGEAEGAV